MATIVIVRDFVFSLGEAYFDRASDFLNFQNTAGLPSMAMLEIKDCDYVIRGYVKQVGLTGVMTDAPPKYEDLDTHCERTLDARQIEISVEEAKQLHKYSLSLACHFLQTAAALGSYAAIGLLGKYYDGAAGGEVDKHLSEILLRCAQWHNSDGATQYISSQRIILNPKTVRHSLALQKFTENSIETLARFDEDDQAHLWQWVDAILELITSTPFSDSIKAMMEKIKAEFVRLIETFKDEQCTKMDVIVAQPASTKALVEGTGSELQTRDIPASPETGTSHLKTSENCCLCC